MSSIHPLIPIIKDLKSALYWLSEDPEEMLSVSPQHPVFHYIKPFHKLPVNTHQDSNQYIPSHQITQLIQEAIQVLHADTATVDFEQGIDSFTEAQLDVDSEILNVLVHDLPAVSHTRHQRDSISFETNPPNVHDIQIQIPAITPIGHTAQRLLSLRQQDVKESTITLTDPVQSADPLSISTDIQIAPSNLSSNFTQTPSTFNSIAPLQSAPLQSAPLQSAPLQSAPSQFWAQNPQMNTPKSDFGDIVPTEQTQKKSGIGSAFDRILASKTSSKKQVVNQIVDSQASHLQNPSIQNSKTSLPIIQEWSTLFQSVHACTQCTRREHHHQSLPCIGMGSQHADFVFVYDQLTTYESQTNIPLSDPLIASLFTDILAAMNLSRSQVYITTLFKCSDESPQVSHWQACQQHFHKELDLLKPKMIISLGQMTARILGHELLIGKLSTYRNIPFLATFSPHEVNRGIKIKAQHWTHLQRVIKDSNI